MAINFLDELLKDSGTTFSVINIAQQIVGTYVSFAFSIFLIPLVIIKPTISFMSAIMVSIRKMNSNFLTLLFINILFFIAGLLSGLTLFIALLWVMPFYLISFGIIARDAYKLQKQPIALSTQTIDQVVDITDI